MPNQAKSSVSHDIESQIVEMWPADVVGRRSTHLRAAVDANIVQRRPVSVSPQAPTVQDLAMPNNVSALNRSALMIITIC